MKGLTKQQHAAPGSPGYRLQTIDALRGAAALAVLLFHASDIGALSDSSGGLIYTAVESIANWGRYGVWLFFVISGFCIHLSWAKQSRTQPAPPPSFGPFWLRRFRRLYPAYFVAILLYAACLSVDSEVTNRTIAGFFLHLVFMQNFVPWGPYTVNEVMWTLAIEEQLYLLYFVFLAIRIRFGLVAAVMFALGARLAWFALAFLLHRYASVDILVTQAALAQWFVWVLGAVAVEAWFGMTHVPVWLQRFSTAIFLLLAAATVSYLYLYFLEPGPFRHLMWFLTDILWGLGFFVLVNKAVSLEGRTGRGVAWLAGVGLFSYSLYLTHELITKHGWEYVLLRFPAIDQVSSVVLLGGLIALSLTLAYIYYLCFERPFLSIRRIEPAPVAPRIQYE